MSLVRFDPFELVRDFDRLFEGLAKARRMLG